MKEVTENEMFLKSFFELELRWLSDRNYQLQHWTNTYDDLWGECIMLYSETWSTIAAHPKNYKLTEWELRQFEKLYEMIKAFEKYYPEFPETPSQFRALLEDPEWKKVQQFAKELRDRIYPRLK